MALETDYIKAIIKSLQDMSSELIKSLERQQHRHYALYDAGDFTNAANGLLGNLLIFKQSYRFPFCLEYTRELS